MLSKEKLSKRSLMTPSRTPTTSERRVRNLRLSLTICPASPDPGCLAGR
jgi:hypothetical protein